MLTSNVTLVSSCCGACRWDIDDSYAALDKSSADDGEEQLGSVLPSGAVVATGGQRMQQQLVNFW
jgi:hypothetical protein